MTSFEDFAPRPTIRQVASLAEVSPTTVSRALRHDPRVSSDLSRRVQAAAESLGYVPDVHLSSLSRRMLAVRNHHHPQRVALIVSCPRPKAEYIHDGQTGAMYWAVLEQAKIMGIQIDEMWTYDERLTPKRVAGVLESRRLSSAIFGLPADGVDGLPLDWEHFTAIALDTRPLPVPMHRVIVSEISAINMILERVRNLGYKRPGLATSPQVCHAREERPACGYLRFGSLLFGALPQIFSTDMWTPDCQAFLDWIDDQKPDVIISDNRHSHHPLSVFLEQLPEQRRPAYVCTDLDPLLFPRLAGIFRCPQTLGRAAVRLLSSLIASNDIGIPAHPVRWMFDPEFRDGPSLPPLVV